MDGKIKELTDLDNFKRIYKVFSKKPYEELYSEEEVEEIFREYQEQGCIYGAYNEEECVGLIALERGVQTEQPVSFPDDEKVMYLADVAVLGECRNQGLGSQLMLYGVMLSKSLGYDRIYMRTLKEGSMSYNIAMKIGFKQIPNLYQSVERTRIDRSVKAMMNIFLDLDLRTLNKDDLMQGIRMTNSSTSIEEPKKEIRRQVPSGSIEELR